MAYRAHGKLPVIRSLAEFKAIYLHGLSVDFRKSINGLVAIVEHEIKLSAFDRYLFVFTNRGRNKLKILYWDDTGFALWYKRLEESKFKWPKITGDLQLSLDELKWLLEGFDISKMKPHKKIFYEKFA